MEKKKLFLLINSLFAISTYGLISDFENNFYYSVEIDYSDNESKSILDKRAEKLANTLGFVSEGQIGELKGHYTFSKRKNKFKRTEDQLSEFNFILKNETDVKWFDEQEKRQHLFKRDEKFPGLSALNIRDPEFHKQWHLYNREQSEDGNDINVVPVWLQGITGKGINVCIVDDGLDYEHPDLVKNFFKEGSYDFNDHRQLPTPTLYNDNHGTRCAGQVAAAINDACGVGIAFDAGVSGVRILSGTLTDADEAASLNYKFQENHIYSCSWGPADDGKTCEGPSPLVAKAFKNGIEKGRDNKGSIFVFATGNGGIYGDNCNFDGYTNSIYTISIGAISSKNEHPPYSEPCSAQIAVTYSSGSSKQITTTDVSIGHLSNPVCTSNHGGTSAAAPIAAGIFALVLNARPELTWRDLQRLAIESAIPVALDDPDWVDTVKNRKFNHKYGYGKLDTEILVKNAKTFKLLNGQTSYESEVQKVDKEIIGNEPVTSTIEILPEHVEKFKHLEHVNVRVNMEHQRRGDVKIDLISPHGLVSNIATSRRKDASEKGLENWLFMSVKHWDEDPVGVWTIRAQNELSETSKGRLIDWTLILWGEVLGEGETRDDDADNNDNKDDDNKDDDNKDDDNKDNDNKDNDNKDDDNKDDDNKDNDNKDDDNKDDDNKDDDNKDEDNKDTPKEENPTENSPTEEQTSSVDGEKTTNPSENEEKPTATDKNDEDKATEVPSEEKPKDNDTPLTAPGGDKGMDYERTHEAIVAAEFAVGIVGIAGVGFAFWRFARKRNYRDDIEFQILDQQKQLMAEEEEDDDDDEYDDGNENIVIDNGETEMHNKIIFENHFLDDEEEHYNLENIETLDLLEDDEISQPSV
jgi:subtilisin-like proprotein convertase family protein